MKSSPSQPTARYQLPINTTHWRHISRSTTACWPKHLRHSLLTSPITNIARFRMKALSIILLFLLFGCATSTQDLIEQARATGGWSVVNKRLEAIERLEAKRSSQSCPVGTVEWCQSNYGSFLSEDCSCVKDSEIRDMVRRMRR